MTSSAIDQGRSATGTTTLWRKAARWGFWFFLIKGLVWLAAPLVAWQAIA